MRWICLHGVRAHNNHKHNITWSRFAYVYLLHKIAWQKTQSVLMSFIGFNQKCGHAGASTPRVHTLKTDKKRVFPSAQGPWAAARGAGSGGCRRGRAARYLASSMVLGGLAALIEQRYAKTHAVRPIFYSDMCQRIAMPCSPTPRRAAPRYVMSSCTQRSAMPRISMLPLQ